MNLPPFHALVCHPDAPDACVRGIRVAAARDADGGLGVHYRLEGALDALRIPAGGLPVERLWAHTCFELFVLAEGGEAYREFNFSPGGSGCALIFPATGRASTARPCPRPGLTGSVRGMP